jgi:transposase
LLKCFWSAGFRWYAINPKQLDRFRDRFTVAGAKDDSRDARVLGDALRTDRHALRRLEPEDPIVIELREWSRMLEDLQQERTRLANRVREQLWRYYPQALELTNDCAADWFLALWEAIPTPAKAAQIEETTVANLLLAKRIRRLNARDVLRILRQKPLWVAPGTVPAKWPSASVLSTNKLRKGAASSIASATNSKQARATHRGRVASSAT